jgi:secreted PhoX family phosphatase
MDRRSFLRGALAGAGAVAFGDVFARSAMAGPAADADASSYGPLGAADADGLMYPARFSGRMVARSGTPVGATTHLWPPFPDGAACFPRPGGAPGWILVVNSENPPAADVELLPQVQDLLGGASAIVFDGAGAVVDAYWVLRGTRSNCAGGVTPWGTWLSCEEYDFSINTPGAAPSHAGRVFECSPTDRGGASARELPSLGRFKHEAATFDALGRVYLTEDVPDGCFYRFTPAAAANTPPSLLRGELHALRLAGDGTTASWVGPIDPGARLASTRQQAQALGATPFSGGEGCFHHDGTVLFTTKGDDRVRALTLGSGAQRRPGGLGVGGPTEGQGKPDTHEVLYDGGADGAAGVLNGVDNIIVSPHTGHIYVAEDGDNMEVVVIETNEAGGRTAAPLVRATGLQHGRTLPSSPVPTASEITGLALSPDGSRLYFNGQRSFALGATYEVTAPPGVRF